ncbi:MAG: hypothetical protein WCK49_09600 [Myxococcaceae bacterium]
MWMTILNGFLIALGPLFLWLLKIGTQKLTDKLGDYVQQKTSNEQLGAFIKRIDDTALRIVKSVYMTYIDAIKKQSGQLTPEEQQKAKQLAVDKLKSYLGASGIQELANIFGYTQAEADKYLDDHIEAAVYDAKNGVRSGLGNGSMNLAAV